MLLHDKYFHVTSYHLVCLDPAVDPILKRSLYEEGWCCQAARSIQDRACYSRIAFSTFHQ